MSNWDTAIIGAGNAALLHQDELPVSLRHSGDHHFALAAILALHARVAKINNDRVGL